MNHKGTLRIETERLILRPFQSKDAEAMFRNWASDPEVTKFLTWPAHASAEITGQLLGSWISGYKDIKSYQWAIELKVLHEPIGSIGAVDVDERIQSVDIGYCIGRSWWGQGITAEALRAVIRFFFEEVEASRVSACHDIQNPNSGKVMKKSGMTYEGIWRGRGVNNQGICDEVWYSILREEYKEGAGQDIVIRNEREEDYRAVEELTRKAFWNINEPGCSEHFLAHVLRGHKDFIPELDLVAVTPGGEIIGNVMYTKSKLVGEEGEEFPILTFGPISVAPERQRKGIGKKMLEYSFQKAVELGYQVIVIYGNPDNYVSRGFKSCAKYNVRSGQGTFPAAMLVKELTAGALDGRKWVYRESPAYEIEAEAAKQFEKQFEPMERGYRTCQEEFYIHSHSVIPVSDGTDE